MLELRPRLIQHAVPALGLVLCVASIGAARQCCVATATFGAESFFGDLLKVYMPRRTCMYRADEVIGRHISRFYTPEDMQRGTPDQQLKIATASPWILTSSWKRCVSWEPTG